MNEQIYVHSTYGTIRQAEINVIEQITVIYDRMNEKIQNAYALILDSLADRVIRRFDL